MFHSHFSFATVLHSDKGRPIEFNNLTYYIRITKTMKKTLLAVAIPAALFANAVSAVELYNDEINTFSIGGHFSAGLTGSDEGNTEVNSVSPRINIEATRDLGNGFTADVKAEWGVNMFEGGENAFETRLGYIGLTHDTYGRAVVGTQWSPYADVALVADMPIAFANDFAYDNQGSLGTARADKMVSYRKGFDLGNAGALNFGLGWQGTSEDEGTDYDDRYQASISYSAFGGSVGYATTSGDIHTTGTKETAKSNLVSASYGSYGNGVYAAAVYAGNEFMNSYAGEALEETIATEAIIAYAFANSLNVSLNYENLEDDTQSETIYSQSALQVEYNFRPNVVGYAAYQVDLGNDKTSVEDNVWMLGARIYL